MDVRLVGSSRLMLNIRIMDGWPLRCSVMLKMVSSSSLYRQFLPCTAPDLCARTQRASCTLKLDFMDGRTQSTAV